MKRVILIAALLFCVALTAMAQGSDAKIFGRDVVINKNTYIGDTLFFSNDSFLVSNTPPYGYPNLFEFGGDTIASDFTASESTWSTETDLNISFVPCASGGDISIWASLELIGATTPNNIAEFRIVLDNGSTYYYSSEIERNTTSTAPGMGALYLHADGLTADTWTIKLQVRVVSGTGESGFGVGTSVNYEIYYQQGCP